MNWREYQETVAQSVRELGFDVEVEAVVRGARAVHHIDVWARSERFGLDDRWAMECKLWKTRVTKGEVLKLISVVDDIGANRGMLFSESGFQPGAKLAADNTNVTLTSLDEFRANTLPQLLQALLRRTEDRLLAQRERYIDAEMGMADELYLLEEKAVDVATTTLFADHVSSQSASADFALIQRALEKARRDDFPVVVGIRDGEPVFTNSLQRLILALNGTLDRLERLLDEQFEKYGGIIEVHTDRRRRGLPPPRLSPWHLLHEAKPKPTRGGESPDS